MKDNIQKILDEKVKKNIDKNGGSDIPDIKVKSAGFWKNNKRTIKVGGVLSLLTAGGIIYSLYWGREASIETGKEQSKPKIEQLENLTIQSLENVRKNSGQLTQQEKERLEKANSSIVADSALLSTLNPKAISKINDDLNGYNALNPNLSEVQKSEHRAELYANILSQARAKSSADSATSVTKIQKDKEAQLTERETLLGRKEQLAIKYQGFDLFLDYVIDGPRSFHVQSLPWKASLRNPKFMQYFNDPTKNIEDFLKIRELGDSSYIPREAVNAFFRGEFDTYTGNIPGEEIVSRYKRNAEAGKVYGIRMRDGNIVGIEELATKNVKYTGPTRKEIKEQFKIEIGNTDAAKERLNRLDKTRKAVNDPNGGK